MELQTKFIEGTNERYAIREDGVIFSYYRDKVARGKGWQQNIELEKQRYRKYETIIMTPCKFNAVRIGPKKTCKSVKILFFNAFGYIICKKCNKKINYMARSGNCNECKLSSIKESEKKYLKNNIKIKRQAAKNYRLNNPDKCKQITKTSNDRQIKTITRTYVSLCLGMSVKDLTDELYHLHRNTLLFKRQITKDNNIIMQSLT
jgi:hypothetical protein